MSSYKMICLGALTLVGCANRAAGDLEGSRAPSSMPKQDAGNSGGGGGTGGGTTLSAGNGSDDDAGGGTGSGGTSTGSGGSSTGSSGATTAGSTGTSAGQTDAGPVATPTGVIITEVMARPDAGSDNEWIEIFNGGKTSLDLMGCALATGADASHETLIAAALSIAPGAYALFGRDGVEAQSGVKPDYVYSGIYLSPDETVTLSCHGQIVSQVSYVGAEVASSLQLDARYVAAKRSDVPSAWCNGMDALPLSKNLGTPKAANRDCAGVAAP